VVRWAFASAAFVSEVYMSGRRSHVRYAVIQSPEGTFRVLRDILVQRKRAGEIIAVAQEPGVLGEAVSVAFPAAEGGTPVRARVVESQPIIVDGSVRHRLTLQELDAGRPSHDETRDVPGPGRS
jgi:hypothetical protein